MHYYLPTTLEFLQSLLDRGQAPSTLNVYVATISSQRVRVYNSTLGCHGQVTLFLKGALSLVSPTNPESSGMGFAAGGCMFASL